MVMPMASSMVTSSWLPSGWPPRDRVAPTEWVTSLSELLRPTTSRAQSRSPLECQRNLRRNVQDRVG